MALWGDGAHSVVSPQLLLPVSCFLSLSLSLSLTLYLSLSSPPFLFSDSSGHTSLSPGRLAKVPVHNIACYNILAVPEISRGFSSL